MREILFRGKRVGNGEWAEGCYIYHHKEFATKETSHFIIDVYGGYRYRVIPETVGEYTGLTDKNGKKIFEGDIVKAVTIDTGKERYVECCIGEFIDCNADDLFIGSYLKLTNGDCISSGQLKQYDGAFIEVIGNVHDNPELLNKEIEK